MACLSHDLSICCSFFFCRLCMWAADEIREIFIFCSPPRPVKRFKCNKDFSCLTVMSPFLFHPPIFDGIPLLSFFFLFFSEASRAIVYTISIGIHFVYLQTIFNLFFFFPPFFGLILPALRFPLTSWWFYFLKNLALEIGDGLIWSDSSFFLFTQPRHFFFSLSVWRARTRQI